MKQQQRVGTASAGLPLRGLRANTVNTKGRAHPGDGDIPRSTFTPAQRSAAARSACRHWHWGCRCSKTATGAQPLSGIHHVRAHHCPKRGRRWSAWSLFGTLTLNRVLLRCRRGPPSQAAPIDAGRPLAGAAAHRETILPGLAALRHCGTPPRTTAKATLEHTYNTMNLMKTTQTAAAYQKPPRVCVPRLPPAAVVRADRARSYAIGGNSHTQMSCAAAQSIQVVLPRQPLRRGLELS